MLNAFSIIRRTKRRGAHTLWVLVITLYYIFINKVLDILKILIRNKVTTSDYSNLPVAMQKGLFLGTATLSQNSLVPKMSLR